ncbi:MAG TPA: GtrA family protein [Anaerolineaceae bacterium]|jgi:putative flippase GtrA|nr:GtrA family protein [Anaerolineaceae bacterium]HPS31895.1 GtrA family protein [Anaerolineaceae bacterium]
MTKKSTPEALRFGKFLMVGALNTLIDFGLMNLFSGWLRMPLMLAQALSFLLAVINSYVFNRLWVYPETQEKSLAGQFSKFALINAAGLALRTLTIPPVDSWFRQLISNNQIQLFGLSPQALSRNFALAVILPLTLILNYLANRYWTFGDIVIAQSGNKKAQV